jgi:hypothetical protein
LGPAARSRRTNWHGRLRRRALSIVRLSQRRPHRVVPIAPSHDAVPLSLSSRMSVTSHIPQFRIRPLASLFRIMGSRKTRVHTILPARARACRHRGTAAHISSICCGGEPVSSGRLQFGLLSFVIFVSVLPLDMKANGGIEVIRSRRALKALTIPQRFMNWKPKKESHESEAAARQESRSKSRLS